LQQNLSAISRLRWLQINTALKLKIGETLTSGTLYSLIITHAAKKSIRYFVLFLKDKKKLKMKRCSATLVFLIVIVQNIFAQGKVDGNFDRLYELIEQKNFFAASEIYPEGKTKLSITQQLFLEAFLNNAFNRLEASNKNIQQLLLATDVPDSLRARLWEIKADNHIKLYEYKEAKEALHTMLLSYKKYLTAKELEDTENSLVIWTALANEPKQEIDINERIQLKLIKDKVGLKNLKVAGGGDSIDFIFDTGANLSTVTRSSAQQLNMRIIPADIKVGTITGVQVNAQLAICPVLHIGTIEVRNAVFLVMADEGLSYPQIDYQIHGIIGYPIIEAMKEIQISQNDYFVVNNNPTSIDAPSNMAMSALTPLIYINKRHFTFDTGADQTMLYSNYYKEFQKEIEDNYKVETVSFAGAGGRKEFDGFKINLDLQVFDKHITLTDITVVKDKIKDREKETVYGNIGQDLIKKFDRMTINFEQMFIKVD
jgi:predicted aspartyl protease